MKIHLRRRILELLKDGYSGLEIAIILGLDLTEVEPVIVRFGRFKGVDYIKDKEVYRQVFKLKAEGKAIEEIADELNQPITYVESSIERDKSKIKTNGRAEECLVLYKQGESLESIAQKFGITRERVRQITKRQYAVELGFGPTERNVRKEEIAQLYRKIVSDSRSERQEDIVSQRVKVAAEKGIQPEYFDSVAKFAQAVGVSANSFKKTRPDLFRIVAKNARAKAQRWSWYYDSCRSCGTTSVKHRGYGYCKNCHPRSPEFKASQQRSHQKNRDVILANNKKYIVEYMRRPEVVERIKREYDEKYFGGNRKLALERDGNRCLGCKMSVDVKGKSGKPIVRVWHLGDKDDNSLESLGTYCQSCLFKYKGINPLDHFGRAR